METRQRNTHDEEISDKSSELLESAAKNDFGLNDQLQIVQKSLEKFNDFIEERDDETVVDVFRTAFNFDSSF